MLSVQGRANPSGALNFTTAPLALHDPGQEPGVPVRRNAEMKKRERPSGRDEAHELIDKALHSSDPEERAFAFSELGLLEPAPAVVLACLEGLRDPVTGVRLEAILALEGLEQPYAIPALAYVAASDSSAEVRKAASDSLAELRDPPQKTHSRPLDP